MPPPSTESFPRLLATWPHYLCLPSCPCRKVLMPLQEIFPSISSDGSELCIGLFSRKEVRILFRKWFPPGCCPNASCPCLIDWWDAKIVRIWTMHKASHLRKHVPYRMARLLPIPGFLKSTIISKLLRFQKPFQSVFHDQSSLLYLLSYSSRSWSACSVF